MDYFSVGQRETGDPRLAGGRASDSRTEARPGGPSLTGSNARTGLSGFFRDARQTKGSGCSGSHAVIPRRIHAMRHVEPDYAVLHARFVEGIKVLGRDRVRPMAVQEPGEVWFNQRKQREGADVSKSDCRPAKGRGTLRPSSFLRAGSSIG